MTQDISIEAYLEQFPADSDFQLIDVREVDEYEEVHMPNALNIPMSEIQYRLDEIAEDKPVVLVCRTANRSAMVADMMSANGYDEVYNLLEGIVGWMRRGYDVIEG
jgi:rhodanese-related sulfurtransferase